MHKNNFRTCLQGLMEVFCCLGSPLVSQLLRVRRVRWYTDEKSALPSVPMKKNQISHKNNGFWLHVYILFCSCWLRLKEKMAGMIPQKHGSTLAKHVIICTQISACYLDSCFGNILTISCKELSILCYRVRHILLSCFNVNTACQIALSPRIIEE